MKVRKMLLAVLAFIMSLPIAAKEFTYTDLSGVEWTCEFVDETDPTQGIIITSSVSTTEGLVLPLEINDGDTTLPVIGISLGLEEGITSIPDNCFQGCSNLTSVVIPTSVASIGENAFNGCSSLSSIIIPNSVTSIGAYAFANCSSLSSITIPESVESIGHDAFAGCEMLASVTILSSSITCIEWQTFWCCGLTSIEIPSSVTQIETMAFVGCRSLTSVLIPESVTYIADGAFGSTGLTSVTIPASVTHIGSGAFSGNSALTSIIIDGNNPVYDSRDNCNAIIETASNTLLQGFRSTVIPSTVTKIAYNAFQDQNITSVYIPEGITEIEGNPFSYNQITSIIVDENNTVYDSRENCNAIIEKATNTLIIGCNASSIPSTVTSIGNNAFQMCQDLSSLTIPSSVTSIGDWAFETSGLPSVFSLPEGLVSIGEGAFAGVGFTSITIPSTVTSIGKGAFSCNLSQMVVSEDNSVYDSRDNCNAIIETSTNTLLFGCNKTIIPLSIKSIGDGAFRGCEFTEITNDPLQASDNCLYLPASVTSIGDYAFHESSITTVALPESLAELGEFALGGGVTSLVSTRTNPFFIENTDIGVAFDCVLHIPVGTKDAYIAAGWTEEVFGGGIVEDGVVPDFVSVSLSSDGAGTFCSRYNLDFSGTEDVKAYIVSAFTPSTGEATLTRIKYVPALTGIVLLGGEGEYDIPVTNKQTVVANLLVGVTGRTQLNKIDGRYTNFILYNGVNGLGFYAVNNGSTLAANRAYLPLPTISLPSSVDVKGVSIRFDDADGVESVLSSEDESPAVYDLSGRKVDGSNLPKGIYIVNGKKIMK